MNLQTFFITLESAVALGSVYALLALSFTLVYASTGYFHLGVGAFVTLGAVGSYVGTVRLGLPWIFTVIVVVLAVAILGIVSEPIAVRPVRGRTRNENFAVIVSTLAFMIVINSLIELSFGGNSLMVPDYLSGAPFQIGNVPIRRIYVIMVGALIVIAFLLELVLRRTGAGRIMRAAQDDSAGLELLGVSFRRVVIGTFGLAGALAGLAGFLVSPVSFASAFVGTDLLVYGFAAMAIGGFGSFAGTMLGGLVVGVVVAFEPNYLPTQLADPIVLAVALAVLLVRPTGLLGRRQLREV